MKEPQKIWARLWLRMLRVRDIWIIRTQLGSHPRVPRIIHHQDRIISPLHMAKTESPTNKLMWEEPAHPLMVVMPMSINNSNITLHEMAQESTSINTELEKMCSTEAHPLEKVATLRNHATLQIMPEREWVVERRASHLLEVENEFRSLWELLNLKCSLAFLWYMCPYKL